MRSAAQGARRHREGVGRGDARALLAALSGIGSNGGELAERTPQDYRDYSVPLLKIFGEARASTITRQDVRRYMTREREGKVRANREVARFEL